jgi:hypothetical protein
MKGQMRKEFEAWISKINSVGKVELNSLKTTVNGDFYLNLNTEMLWQAWQASREEIVVELPDWFMFGIDAACYRDDVIEALNKAGVSYK